LGHHQDVLEGSGRAGGGRAGAGTDLRWEAGVAGV